MTRTSLEVRFFLFLWLDLLNLSFSITQVRQCQRHHRTADPQGVALVKFFGCLIVT